MFDSFIAAASDAYNVPVSWIKAVIEVETGGTWDPNAYNPNDPGGARGLMQIIAQTAYGLGITDLNSLFDPAVNIDAGTRLLGQLRAAYGDDFSRVYSAYNSGRPDLYLTSAEVADHVNKALAALSLYVSEGVGEVQAGSPAGLLIVGAILLFLWNQRS